MSRIGWKRSLARRFARIVRTAAAILRQEPRPDRGELLRDYLRFELGQLGRRSRRPTTIRMLGMTVHFLNEAAFHYAFEEIFADRIYRFETRSESPVIVDCGSNIGLGVLYFKHVYPQARVICFEPEPEAFDCLRRNVESNGLSGITLTNAAVLDRDGPAEFHSAPGALTSSLDPRHGGPTATNVQAVRLSSVLAEQPAVDMLKLDVEGAEIPILGDLAETGQLDRVRELIVELHHHIDPKREDVGPFLTTLEQRGFGYQLAARWRGWSRESFQDVLIYAYRRDG